MSLPITTPAAIEDKGEHADNVVYLHRSAVDEATPSSLGSTRRDSVNEVVRNKVVGNYDSFFRPMEIEVKNLVQGTFERIAESLDTDRSESERSNSFDDWKDSLTALSRVADTLTGNHRKVIGALISITTGKDISDFDKSYLRGFREATNIVRQPRVSKPEAKRVISFFHSRATRISLPLAVDDLSEESAKEIESMMAGLVARITPANG